MASNAEIAEYLEGGAAALADGEVKWVTHDFGSLHDMTACAYGACNYARTKSYMIGLRYSEALRPVLIRLYDVDSLHHYNDVKARSVDDVIDCLRNTAKEFRNATD